MDPESVRFMAREIHTLRRLDHPNVVKLEGIVTSRMSGNLYLVFEYMDHDLTGLAATPGIKLTEPQIKCYMQQLLRGLEHFHSHGVLHRDIKGSNLLIDNNGILRLADFGLATFFYPDQKQSLTIRVVTLWYRPPELLLGTSEYGVAVDLWSSRCILAEFLAGKPIMPGRTEVEQLHKIFKFCGSSPEEYWRKPKLPHATIFKPQHPYTRRIGDTFRDCPPSTLALLDTLLAFQPEDRGTATSSLQSAVAATPDLMLAYIDFFLGVLDSAVLWWKDAMTGDDKLCVIMPEAASFKLNHGHEREAFDLYEELVNNNNGDTEALLGAETF